MKKLVINRLKVLVTVVVCASILVPTIVLAENITKSKPIATFVTSKKGKKVTNGYPHIYVDGKTGYCMDPNLHTVINDKEKYTANPTEWNKLSKTKQDEIYRYAYYGYEYPGHQSDDYLLATQLLIWEVLGWDTTWYYYNTANKRSVSSKTKEIKSLAETHNIKPSFSDSEVLLDVSSSVELIDSNNVLKKFDLIDMSISGLEITKNGNKLTITLSDDFNTDDIDDIIIIGNRKSGTAEGSPILYTKAKSQRIFSTKNADPLSFELTLSIGPGIRKKDTLGQAVEGAVFKIGEESDLSDGVEYVTNATGVIKLDLEPGFYYAQEISAPEQYIYDDTIIGFEVVDGEIFRKIFINDIKPITIRILKADVENGKGLEGAEFRLFNIDDEENPIDLGSGVSDGNGYIKWPNLDYYSSYLAVETKLPEGYDYVNGVDQWEFRPADLPYQEVFNITMENKVMTLGLTIYKTVKNKQYLIDGAIFSVEELDEDENVVEDLGRMITGGIYLEDQPGKQYLVMPKEKWESLVELEREDLLLNDEVTVLTLGKDGSTYDFFAKDDYAVVDADTYEYETIYVSAGTIVFPEVKYGYKYRVCEVQAPLGYDRGANYCEILVPTVDYGVEYYEYSRENTATKSPPTGEGIETMLLPIMGMAGAVMVFMLKRKKARKS